MDDELGVFAWVKLAKGDAGTSNQGFEADFCATFVQRTGDGTVTPPDPAQAEVSSGLRELVSIDMPNGLWTLYAKGPAVTPARAKYEVGFGPLSQRRRWIEDNAAWTEDAAFYALVTLSSTGDVL